MKLSIEVGSRIRELRTEHGDNQVALAEKIGVSQCTISQWEYGYYLPTIAHILALCKLYNSTPNYILLGEPKIERKPFGALIDGDELLHIVYDGENVVYEKEGVCK